MKIEEGEFPFQDSAALGEVAVGFDFEGGSLGFEGDIACLEFPQGNDVAAEVFELGSGVEVALLELPTSSLSAFPLEV